MVCNLRESDTLTAEEYVHGLLVLAAGLAAKEDERALGLVNNARRQGAPEAMVQAALGSAGYRFVDQVLHAKVWADLEQHGKTEKARALLPRLKRHPK